MCCHTNLETCAPLGGGTGRRWRGAAEASWVLGGPHLAGPSDLELPWAPTPTGGASGGAGASARAAGPGITSSPWIRPGAATSAQLIATSVVLLVYFPASARLPGARADPPVCPALPHGRGGRPPLLAKTGELAGGSLSSHSFHKMTTVKSSPKTKTSGRGELVARERVPALLPFPRHVSVP